jgi:hypothetical protein
VALVIESPVLVLLFLGFGAALIGPALALALGSRALEWRGEPRRQGRSAGPALRNDARYRTSVIAVKDSFYVVPIGVEDECGVVPGVIVRSQPGPSVVDPSRLDGCGVERINRFAHGYCRRESSQHRGLGRRRGARP